MSLRQPIDPTRWDRKEIFTAGAESETEHDRAAVDLLLVALAGERRRPPFDEPSRSGTFKRSSTSYTGGARANAVNLRRCHAMILSWHELDSGWWHRGSG